MLLPAPVPVVLTLAFPAFEVLFVLLNWLAAPFCDPVVPAPALVVLVWSLAVLPMPDGLEAAVPLS